MAVFLIFRTITALEFKLTLTPNTEIKLGSRTHAKQVISRYFKFYGAAVPTGGTDKPIMRRLTTQVNIFRFTYT